MARSSSRKRDRRATPSVCARLAGHVTLAARPDGSIEAGFDGGSVGLGTFGAGVAERAPALRVGLPLAALAAGRRAIDKDILRLIRRLAGHGLLEYGVGSPGGTDQAVIEPQVADYWPRTPKLGDGATCTGNNQCTSGACNIFYRDADGDGYGAAGTTKRVCGSAAPSGYVTDATDCCDADGMVHPGQTGWFTTAAAAGCGASFYNYDCVNGVESQYGAGLASCTTMGSCTAADPKQCVEVDGWQTADPGCGNSGLYLDYCSQSLPCHCGTEGETCGSACSAPVFKMQQQACH